VKEVEILKDAPHAAFDKWLDQAKARLSAEVTLQHLQSLLLVSLGDGKTPSKTDEQD
jgi:hypothetical protein